MNRRNLFFFFAFLALAAVATAVYMWNKPHRNVQTEQARFALDIAALKGELIGDPPRLEHYLDQVMVLNGQVTESATDHVVLDNFAYVEWLEPAAAPVEEGSTISVKARVVAFDELFGQLRLDQGALEP
ncbi:hypothetical protein GC167_08990 [bacterium]|nr:hypothetical protein [bacterium]